MVNRKIIISLLILIWALIPLSAKDSFGLGFQFGALGYEKTFSTSSTISGDTVSMPYTKTTFNPDLHVFLDIPVCDFNDFCFFELNLGYDFSWDYTYLEVSPDEIQKYTLFHRILLMPDIVFAKSNFRFFAGTGVALGIEPYKSESKIGNTDFTNEYTTLKILWTSNAGLKYKLTEHLFALADLTCLLSIYDAYSYDDYKFKSSGNSEMEFLPKIGFAYHF